MTDINDTNALILQWENLLKNFPKIDVFLYRVKPTLLNEQNTGGDVENLEENDYIPLYKELLGNHTKIIHH